MTASQSIEYYERVRAPVLFETMAAELLRRKPEAEQVIPTLLELLKRRMNDEEDIGSKEDEEIYNGLHDKLGLSGTTFQSVLSKLGLDEDSAEVFIPSLKPDENGQVTKELWNNWLINIPSKQREITVSWLTKKSQQQSSSDTRTADTSKRIDLVFENVDDRVSKDGSVTLEELLNVLQQDRLSAKILFAELDCNSNGRISKTEWDEYFKSIATSRGSDAVTSRLEWLESCLLADCDEGETAHLVNRSKHLNKELQDICDAIAPSTPRSTTKRRSHRSSSVRFTDEVDK